MLCLYCQGVRYDVFILLGDQPKSSKLILEVNLVVYIELRSSLRYWYRPTLVSLSTTARNTTIAVGSLSLNHLSSSRINIVDSLVFILPSLSVTMCFNLLFKPKQFGHKPSNIWVYETELHQVPYCTSSCCIDVFTCVKLSMRCIYTCCVKLHLLTWKWIEWFTELPHPPFPISQ